MKQTLRNHLLQTCSELEIAKWFDPLTFHFDENQQHITIFFPHRYFGIWFQLNMQTKLENIIGNYFQQEYSITYDNIQYENTPLAQDNAHKTKTQKANVQLYGKQKFLLDNFLFHQNDRVTTSVIQTIIQGEKKYNPLLICGEKSSGKTHLLQAIRHEIEKYVGKKDILFVSPHDLKKIYKSSFKNKIQAREYIFSHEYLFIDDLHHLHNSTVLHNELIDIFNHFYENNQQMFFSCFGHAHNIFSHNQQLQSRIHNGFIISLQQPNLELRIQYIQNFDRIKKLQLLPEQMLCLAQQYTDFRSLYGILLHLVTHRDIKHHALSQKEFEQILSHRQKTSQETLKSEDIIATVAEYFNITIKEMKGELSWPGIR